MNADGTGQTRLTNHSGFDAVSNWSPDGQKIVFQSEQAGGGNSEIYSMLSNGTLQTRLTNNSAADTTPAWSHAGQRIAFNSTRDGNQELYSMSPAGDGFGWIRLTHNAAVDEEADFQPIVRGFPRPKGATPLRVPLVPAFQQCTVGNRMHGAPFSYQSCAPATQSSGWLTVGTPDANARQANSIGSYTLNVLVGNPANAIDDADVRLTLSITDVRNKASLTDYTGQLLLNLRTRITDKINGYGGDTGTAVDLDLGVVFFCVATSDSNVGGSCTGTSTYDALYPGIVKEDARAVWELNKVELYDGGSDGLISTSAGNTLFATQGVFVP